MKNLWIFLGSCFIACAVSAASGDSSLKKATFVWWPHLAGNVFKWNSTIRLLQEKLAVHGYDLQNQKINPPEKSDLVLVAYPHYKVPREIKDKSFLWLLESPIGIKTPPDADTESRYKKIFTYDENLAKRPNYVHVPIYYNISTFEFKLSDLADKTVLVAQVAGYNRHNNPKNIYKERDSVVRYFLENHPEDILFAGRGNWKKGVRNGLDPKTQQVFDQKYKGKVKDKIAFLGQAKFGLAYENAKAPGYVSEKIFDVMAAKTVPVYLGAPDIEKYVPKACFINRDDFKSDEELYTFLKNMTDQTYLTYITCINQFMSNFSQSEKSPDAVSDILVREMLNEEVFGNSNTTH